ncbi:MAG: ribonuclease PH [Phycisphaeraceae bacterium]
MPRNPKPRKPTDLRPVTIEPFPSAAVGSVIISQGDTRVLCTASISTDVPKFLCDKVTGVPLRGWVTAEYSMLPGSTRDRKKRGPDGRATEIQRLIGRVLRAAVDLDKMPGLVITCDCDVLVADGGTRTASITGAFVALAQAVAHARAKGIITRDPIKGPIAAISVGIIDGKAYLDLDYPLDSKADVDMNVAMNHKGEFIEIQGTGEGGTFTRKQLDELLALAGKGIGQLMKIQRKVTE